MTHKKLVKEKMLVHSLLRGQTKEEQVEVMKQAKRDHLNTIVSMAKKCYTNRSLLKKYSPKDQIYLRKKKDEVISALENIRLSNLRKEQMIDILSKISSIDDGKILRKLLKSYVVVSKE